jgi:hypothetical protein
MNIVFKGLSKFVDVMINRGALTSPSTGKTGAILNGLILRFAEGIGWKFQAFAEWIFALRPAMDRYVACRASNTILMPHASGQGLVE